MYLYLLVNSNVNTKRVESGEWEGASLSSAIAQPCPKLSTLHRFALTLQFHNRFIDRPCHAQAKIKWNTSTQLKTFPRSSKFAFPVFCYFVSAQFISCASFSFIISFSLVCNFSATHIKRLERSTNNTFQKIFSKDYTNFCWAVCLLVFMGCHFNWGVRLQLTSRPLEMGQK